MGKNLERARALKGKLPEPVQQDLSGIEAQLTGIQQALKVKKASNTFVNNVSTQELEQALSQLRDVIEDFKFIVSSMDGIKESIESLQFPDYSGQLLAIKEGMTRPPNKWRHDVKRMGGPTSPIKEVISEAIDG